MGLRGEVQSFQLIPFDFSPLKKAERKEPPSLLLPLKRQKQLEEATAIQQAVESAVQEADSQLLSTVDPRAVEAVNTEPQKEEEARSKGNFLTSIIEKASEIFSVLNIWYHLGRFMHIFIYKRLGTARNFSAQKSSMQRETSKM